MLRRLLLDPTAPAEGVTPEPAPAPAGPAVDIVAEFRKLQEMVTNLTREKSHRTEQDAAVREKQLKDKGQFEELIRERDARLKEVHDTLTRKEARFREHARDKAIAEAISSAGLTLTKAAPGQLAKLWRDEFEAVEQEDGSFRVQTKDFKSPAQIVRERLASEDYANFVLAGSKGGHGPGGGNQPAQTPDPTQGGTPPSFEQSVFAAWEQRKAVVQEGPSWQHDFRSQLKR